MSDTGIVCRLPFRWEMVRNFAPPDLTRAPPRIAGAMTRPVPPELDAYSVPNTTPGPAPGAAPAAPTNLPGVAVRGPRPRINACIVVGIDGSGSVLGEMHASARDRLGGASHSRPLSETEVREQQFGAQLAALARALRDPLVQDMALAGPNPGIAVLPLQAGARVEAFFSPDERDVPACEGWAMLTTREEMNAYADRLLDLRRTMQGSTQIGEVVSAGTDLLATCPGYAQFNHVNVMVQDRDNIDGRPENNVAAASASGVQTNLAGIDLDPQNPADRRELVPYYRNVIQRHGVVEWLTNAEDYVEILRRQLSPRA